MKHDVLVIGRGIIGSSIAYYLQKAGANVTIISDTSERATDGSFGWINASFFNDEAYFRLRNEGLSAYGRLVKEVTLPISWSGCLCWENTGEALVQQARELRDLGYQADIIELNAFTRLEPDLPNPPSECLFMPQEAAAESGDLADALYEAALRLGAQEIRGRVTQLETVSGKVTGAVVGGELIKAHHVVVAAGTQTPSLINPLGCALTMLERPAVILQTKPVAQAFSHVLVSQLGEVRQLPDGSILMPAAVGHQSYETPVGDQNVTQAAAEALARLEDFTGLSLEIDWAKLAYRPVPQDGLPVVGRIASGAYVAVMHSGITLAAIIGELVCSEVLNGPNEYSNGWLDPYRPERFGQ